MGKADPLDLFPTQLTAKVALDQGKSARTNHKPRLAPVSDGPNRVGRPEDKPAYQTKGRAHKTEGGKWQKWLSQRESEDKPGQARSRAGPTRRHGSRPTVHSPARRASAVN